MTVPRQPEPFHAVFAGTQSAIRPALRDLRAHFELAGLTPATLGPVELALAEVLNNVAKHAYAGRPPGSVDLLARLTGNALCITVRDDGCVMPGGTPPQGVLPQVGTARETLPEGGFGWFLIRDLTQAVNYCREGKENRLDLRFSCPDTAG